MSLWFSYVLRLPVSGQRTVWRHVPTALANVGLPSARASRIAWSRAVDQFEASLSPDELA